MCTPLSCGAPMALLVYGTITNVSVSCRVQGCGHTTCVADSESSKLHPVDQSRCPSRPSRLVRHDPRGRGPRPGYPLRECWGSPLGNDKDEPLQPTRPLSPLTAMTQPRKGWSCHHACEPSPETGAANSVPLSRQLTLGGHQDHCNTVMPVPSSKVLSGQTICPLMIPVCPGN